jgi:hypothetical protein
LQVVPVLRAFGNDAIRLAHEPALDVHALLRKAVRGALVQAPHEAERMEGHDQRRAEATLQLESDEAGHEKVCMHHVVATGAFAEANGAIAEVAHQRQQRLLWHGLWRAGIDVPHAQPGPHVDGCRQAPGITPRQDIHLVPSLG